MFELGTKKHSGIGIASFVTALVALVILVISIAISTVLVIRGVSSESVYFALAGIGIVLSLILNLISIGLGLFGLLLKRYKKIFSILGFVISVAVLIGTIVIMTLGAMHGM